MTAGPPQSASSSEDDDLEMDSYHMDASEEDHDARLLRRLGVRYR
ncbi:hypothetical protein E2C01_099505 [Portunus trituberculatus]|uniref:Uncharacterized protein n=1 Tax=Portunus trituberculatus TaxID=210409 RepID=A0A5B7K9T8_PORTR|nr:hypothetical protein [Portunus trituberculatus]